MKYDAVILDLDGTLINTLPDITDVVNSVIGNIGMSPCSEDRIRAAVGSGVEALLRKLGVPEQWNGPLAGEIASGYVRIKHSKAFVYPGVKEMLDRLFQGVDHVCVLSNKPMGGVLTSLKDHLPGYTFSRIGGSALGVPAKPCPDTMLEILGELGVEPARALMIGDGEHDCEVSMAAGTDHLGVLWGYRTRDILEGAGAENFAETPQDVLKFTDLSP